MPKTRKFGDLLRKKRTDAKKTLGDVARHLGFSVPYVSDVERGARAPWGGLVTRKLAQFLETDSSELLLAAAASRGAFELDAEKATPAQQQAGVALMRGWPEWDDEDFQTLHDAINRINKKERKR